MSKNFFRIFSDFFNLDLESTSFVRLFLAYITNFTITDFHFKNSCLDALVYTNNSVLYPQNRLQAYAFESESCDCVLEWALKNFQPNTEIQVILEKLCNCIISHTNPQTALRTFHLIFWDQKTRNPNFFSEREEDGWKE